MSGELVASLVSKLNDQGSGAAARALQTVTRATKETGDAAKSALAAAVSAAKRTADAREVWHRRASRAKYAGDPGRDGGPNRQGRRPRAVPRSGGGAGDRSVNCARNLMA